MSTNGTRRCAAEEKEAEKELLSWIKRNRQLFRSNPEHYTPDYVSWLARMNGFDDILVYRIMSHFQDVLTGSSVDNRVKMHVDGEVMGIERASGKINLKQQWMDLYLKVEKGRDFDE